MRKVGRRGARRNVLYDEGRWRTLREKRALAAKIIEMLRSVSPDAVVLGSVARGDVSESSDVDVAIPTKAHSYLVELAAEEAVVAVHKRMIVQATPVSSPRAYMFLDQVGLTVVSFPLTRITRSEEEFSRFGGCLTHAQIMREERVPGVDKRLMLIEPTATGHMESSLLGKEVEVARLLRVSLETVNERTRVLMRRDEVGRTGPVVKYELSREESFETALAGISRRNPILRRVLEERGA